jgi:hypothetical protein
MEAGEGDGEDLAAAGAASPSLPSAGVVAAAGELAAVVDVMEEGEDEAAGEAGERA